MEDIEGRIEDMIRRAMKRMNCATLDDIKGLEARIRILEQKADAERHQDKPTETHL